MESKFEQVLEPFFGVPKFWHFDELLKKSNISRPQLVVWLKKLEKDSLIKRIKKNGKMPYYVGLQDNVLFRNKKRLFGIKRLYDSGLIDHLASLEKTKVIILFGSFIRGDWHSESDIDLFIYGSDNDFEKGKYELLLKREIQVHNAKNKKDLKMMEKLLPHIISGLFIKGSIDDLGVKVYAKD